MRFCRVLRRFFLPFIGIAILLGQAAAPQVLKAEDAAPAAVIYRSPSERPAYAVLVDKSEQRLHLYRIDRGLERVFTMRCSTGENKGAKTRSGDRKTPEGVYFFTNAYEQKDLSPIYGTRAFPIDYPNSLDRLRGLTGNSIWLHGTNKPIRDRDSNGCIALQNEDIDRLAPYITLYDTPIIIQKKLEMTADETGRKRFAGRVQELLEGYREALVHGSYHDYLSFYDDAFLPEIDWWTEWEGRKVALTGEKRTLGIEFGDTAVYRHGDMAVATVSQTLLVDDTRIPVGVKTLFLSVGDGGLHIVAEAFSGLNGEDMNAAGNPLVIAANSFHPMADTRTEIADMIEDWLKAWSAKDIDQYGAFYARDFSSQGMGLDSWIAYKRDLNKKYDYIKVTSDRLRIKNGDKRATASFVQTYEASGYRAVGMKSLLLKRENGQWKIYRETFRRK